MEPDAANRFASARAMEQALAEFVATLGPEAFAPVELAPVQPAAALPTVRGPAIPVRLGRYTIEGTLGRGGAGIVLMGRDERVERRVALKLLDVAPGRRDRLVAEARAMARVNHPNVLALYELGEDGDAMFLALEYVEGSDLSRWLGSVRRTTREILDVFVAAGRGLAAAHDAGVVHRDFKPANVLVGDDGRPRVLDFGLATGGDAAPAGGTPAYMAPEQLEGGHIDARADQFAFAASLWEALHGELPYAGDSAAALAIAARRGDLRAPAGGDVPARVQAALRRALSASPGDRFPAMRDLLAALAAPSRSPRVPWLVAGGAGLAAIVAVAVLARTSTTRAPSLDDIRALPDPGDVLRALATLDDATLATPEARRLALEAAARGPTARFDATDPITAIAFDGDRLAVATGSAIAIHDVHSRAVSHLAAPDLARALHFDGPRVRVLVRDGVDDLSLDGGPVSRRHCAGAAGPVTATADLAYVACPDGAIVGPDGTARMRIEDGAWLGFSSDSRRGLAVVGGRLEIRELATGALSATRAAGSPQAIALSGELCAIAEPSRLVIWNVATDTTVEAALGGITHIAVAGPWIAAATPDEVVLLDAAGDRQMRWTEDAPARGVDVIATPEAGVRVLVEEATQIVVKDVSRDREVVLPGVASSIVWASGGHVLAVASGTQARLWHTDVVVPATLPVSDTATSPIARSHDGRIAAYGDAGAVHLVTLARLGDQPHPVTSPASRLAFSPDDRLVAWIDRDGRALVSPLARIEPRDAGMFPFRVKALRVRDDGSVIAVDEAGSVVVDGARRPCGSAPELAISETRAVVDDDSGSLAICELATGTRTPLPIARAQLRVARCHARARRRRRATATVRPRRARHRAPRHRAPRCLARGRACVRHARRWQYPAARRERDPPGRARAVERSRRGDRPRKRPRRGEHRARARGVGRGTAHDRRAIGNRDRDLAIRVGRDAFARRDRAGIVTTPAPHTGQLLVAWPIEALDAAEVRRWSAAVQ